MNTQIKTTKKNRAAIIAAAVGAALCLVITPLLTPQAEASLDNGGFCIPSTYDSDPEIKGMAGNCKPIPSKPTEEEVEEVAAGITGFGITPPNKVHPRIGSAAYLPELRFIANGEAPEGYSVEWTATHRTTGEIISLGSGFDSPILSWDDPRLSVGRYDISLRLDWHGETVHRFSWTGGFTVLKHANQALYFKL